MGARFPPKSAFPLGYWDRTTHETPPPEEFVVHTLSVPAAELGIELRTEGPEEFVVHALNVPAAELGIEKETGGTRKTTSKSPRNS